MKEKIEFSTIAGGVTYSRLLRERLARLGWGAEVDRARAEEICGTASAANQFLDRAVRGGLLVPIGWGAYRVVDLETFEHLRQVPNPAFQRFIAWASVAPSVVPGVTFLAPRLWRDTDLSEERPLPVLPLQADNPVAPMPPPQWDAIAADVARVETWEIAVAGRRIGTCKVPSAPDAAVLLRETLDPRWAAAAAELERRRSKAEREPTPRRVVVTPFPRTRESRNIGIGLPTLRRIVAPRWYVEARLRGVAEVTRRG